MSFWDNLSGKSKKSTRQFTGIEGIGDALRTVKGELIYFKVSPANVSVLSPEAAEVKIRQLMTVLALGSAATSGAELELCCYDSAENFNANKQYLKRRIAEETEPAVRELLQLDLAHLDEMQIKASTQRDFVFVARFRRETPEQVFNAANRVEKIIKTQGFEVRRLGKEDIKKLLTIYFERNVTSETLPDYDGSEAVLANSRTEQEQTGNRYARAGRSDGFENQE
jgi:hypothetical protein